MEFLRGYQNNPGAADRDGFLGGEERDGVEGEWRVYFRPAFTRVTRPCSSGLAYLVSHAYRDAESSIVRD